MYHDFTNEGGSKFDSKGQACTNIGGYMDYVSNPTKWSTCSVEDYTKYYNSVQPWCLTPRKILLVIFQYHKEDGFCKNLFKIKYAK